MKISGRKSEAASKMYIFNAFYFESWRTIEVLESMNTSMTGANSKLLNILTYFQSIFC